jgi:hypothetical protein
LSDVSSRCEAKGLLAGIWMQSEEKLEFLPKMEKTIW